MKVPHAGMIESTDSHFVLLQFIAAKDDQLLGMVFLQEDFDAFLAEGARSTRDQHNAFLPIHETP